MLKTVKTKTPYKKALPLCTQRGGFLNYNTPDSRRVDGKSVLIFPLVRHLEQSTQLFSIIYQHTLFITRCLRGPALILSTGYKYNDRSIPTHRPTPLLQLALQSHWSRYSLHRVAPTPKRQQSNAQEPKSPRRLDTKQKCLSGIWRI